MTEHFINIRGKKVHYYSHGHGPEVAVLVHGWLVCGYSWFPLISHLPLRLKCIVPDLPGFGLSESLNTTHSAENYAKFINDFVIALKLNKPHLIGTSMGSNIILLTAGLFPELVGKVVAHCPPYFPKIFVRFWEHNVWLGYVEKSLPFMAPSLAFFYRTRIYRWWYLRFTHKDLDKISSRLINEIWRRSLHFNIRAAKETIEEIMVMNLSENLKKVVAPTLIVTGTCDAQPLWVERHLTREILPNAELVVVNGASHSLAVSRCVEFASIITNFLFPCDYSRQTINDD